MDNGLESIAQHEQRRAITLEQLVSALDTAVVGSTGAVTEISSAALVDPSDLITDADSPAPPHDLWLLIGVTDERLIEWLNEAAADADAPRPRAAMVKTALEQPHLARLASTAGLAVVTIHPKARWEQVHSLVHQVLHRSRHQPLRPDPDLVATDTDLFGLARIVAQNSRGMVSIEDEQSKVLAYSASDETADELRKLSILGREGPRDYLKALQQLGVFDKLRTSDDVVEVPAREELGTRRRLVVSIRQQNEYLVGGPRLLGSIWIQQGSEPLSPDSADVLRGASAIAARLISRSLDAPTTEGLLIQRLFGARGGGVDTLAVANALDLPVTGPAAVVGFATMPAVEPDGLTQHLTKLGSLLRLHASSFRRDSVATVIRNRAYVLFPRYQTPAGVAAWTRHLIDEFEAKRSILLRAAIAAPVADLGHVAEARAEVDRVLDGTAATLFPADRVTTLAESRTAVLLGEVLDLLASLPAIHDPRLDLLLDYDETHDSTLRESVETYLRAHGDVRTAAKALHVHPNTLRYRIRRMEEITGITLSDSSDRLLTELQLALHRSRQPSPEY